MKKINFINGQAPAINASNLNQIQMNAETSIDEVNEKVTDYIITTEYTSESTEVTTKATKNVEIATSVPNGYFLVGYLINGNGYNSTVFSSVISATDTRCVINIYNNDSATRSISVKVKGIYAKK